MRHEPAVGRDFPAPGKGGGAKAAVVLLPAVAGVNDYVTRRAEALVRQGYLVHVLDYYTGRAAPDLSSPEAILDTVRWLSRSDIPARTHDAGATLQKELGGPARVGVLGFCVGGTYAAIAAGDPLFSAAVNYYGGIVPPSGVEASLGLLGRVSGLEAPLLSHYGSADRFVPPADVDAYLRSLDEAGKVHEMYRYWGAPHAFDEDFREAYRAVAAREAWQRSSTWLAWYLAGRPLAGDPHAQRPLAG